MALNYVFNPFTSNFDVVSLVAIGTANGLSIDSSQNLSLALATSSTAGAAFNVGAANGIATLDSGGKVPVAQLPSTVMLYLGAWNASTNSPTLADGTGTNGDTYRASVAGTQNLGSGSQTWAVGDLVIYNGSIWQHCPAADGVSSVNGYTGAVVLTTTDVAEGTNLYFTTARAQAAISATTPLVDTAGVLTINQSTTSTDGYLSSTDWNTFNGKQSTLTLGNLTDAGTDGITVTGGTGAVVGSGTSLSQHVADTTHNGYLSSADWNTFNNKQATISLGAVGSSPNADAATFTTNTLALQPFSSAYPGVVAASGGGTTNYLRADGTWAAPAGVGTVTSVGMTVPAFLSVSGSPITGSGTLGVTLSGTALPVANGGTGATAYNTAFNNLSPMTALGDMIYGGSSPAGAGARLAGNTTATKNFLTSTGNGSTSLAPAWGTIAAADLSNITNTQLSGTAGITNANLATMAANTVKANVTGSSAVPTDVSIVSAATASAAMIRDANANVSVNALLSGYTTAATAGGTTTLVVGSTWIQNFSGTTTQTVVLPVVSTLVLGQSFFIQNNSTGTVTVNSSGSNLVQAIAAGASAIFTTILITGTTAASWYTSYSGSVGMNGTAWKNDLTFGTSNLGTISGSNIWYRRVGDSMEVRGQFSVGTPSASPGAITLPSGYTIDTTKIQSTTNAQQLGVAYQQTNASSSIQNSSLLGIFFDGSTTGSIYITDHVTSNVFQKSNASVIFSSGQGISFQFTIPITGWAATGTAVVTETSARYYASSTSISGSLATISWTTEDYDTANGMSSGTYTVPYAGKYQINAAILLSGTFILNNTLIMEIQKNSSVVSRETQYAGGAITNFNSSISDIINCAANDTIRIQVSSSGTGPAIVSSNFDNYISLVKVSD